jgi:transcriptional regulator with XRE-family HTH domain
VRDQEKFFTALGQRIKELRRKRGYSQEDMISFGFSARHWQQIEAGRPITVTTLLRICEALEVNLVRLLRGLDADA